VDARELTPSLTIDMMSRGSGKEVVRSEGRAASCRRVGG